MHEVAAPNDPYRAPEAPLADGALELAHVPPLRRRTRAVLIALTLTLIATASQVVLDVLARLNQPVPEGLDAVRRINFVAGSALTLATFVASGLWYHRAVVRTQLCARYWHVTPNWAVAYWIIPVLALVRPFQVTRDMWRIGHGGATRPLWETLLFAVWWFAWLISVQCPGTLAIFALHPAVEAQPKPQLNVLGLVAGGLYYWIVDGIAAAQEKRLGAA